VNSCLSEGWGELSQGDESVEQPWFQW